MIYVLKNGKIIAQHTDNQKQEIKNKYPGASFFCNEKTLRLFILYTPSAKEISDYEALQ